MVGNLLTVDTAASCPHGGQVHFVPDHASVLAGGSPVLLVSTIALIAGCPLNVAGAPSPCVTVRWLTSAVRVSVQGTPALLTTSTGLCLNPASAPQGPVRITSAQYTVAGE